MANQPPTSCAQWPPEGYEEVAEIYLPSPAAAQWPPEGYQEVAELSLPDGPYLPELSLPEHPGQYQQEVCPRCDQALHHYPTLISGTVPRLPVQGNRVLPFPS